MPIELDGQPAVNFKDKDPGSQQGVKIPMAEQQVNPFRGISYGVDEEVNEKQSAYSSSIDPGGNIQPQELEAEAKELASATIEPGIPKGDY
jgi:hypothetical protein